MKTKKFFLPVCALVALMLTSCASYTNSGAVMSIRSNNINTYVAADIDYDNAKKVEATVEVQKLFGFINLTRNGNKQFNSTNRYRDLSKVERQALYRAKVNGKVDIILEPEFTTERHSWFFGAYKTFTTKVNGWGVNIKGLKEDSRANY